MQKKKNRFTQVYFKYITVLLLALMVVLGVVLFARVRGTGDKDTGTPDETQESSSQEQSSETEAASTEEVLPTMTEAPTEPSVPDKDQMEVTALMRTYYQAKVDDDLPQLNRLVDSDHDYNNDDVTSNTQIVDRYDDFILYIMPGADSDSFIVYVRYNIYFNGIDMGAPSLNHYYVIRTEDGMKIYDRPLSAQQQASLLETENSETVRKLKEQVDRELEEACEQSLDLKYFMAILNHTTVDESTEQ